MINKLSILYNKGNKDNKGKRKFRERRRRTKDKKGKQGRRQGKRGRQGKSNQNKQNRENTNTVGALDNQGDESQRGGIISSTSTGTSTGTATTQTSSNATTNQALIAELRNTNSQLMRNKSKAGGQGTSPSFTTQAKRKRSKSRL